MAAAPSILARASAVIGDAAMGKEAIGIYNTPSVSVLCFVIWLLYHEPVSASVNDT